MLDYEIRVRQLEHTPMRSECLCVHCWKIPDYALETRNASWLLCKACLRAVGRLASNATEVSDA